MDELLVTPTIAEIVSHPARFKVLTTGRRWGKDRLGMIWLHAGELLPDRLYWYVAPYRVQAKAIAWPLLKRIARNYGVGGRDISESELAITWPNGARTELKGADNPDSLLGVGVEKVLATEFSRWRPDIWPQIIRPMLTQSKGRVMFNSTPRGYDHHYDLHMRGQDDSQADWASWTFRTADSPFVDPAEVTAARADMDPWLYRQEYEGSFETAGNRACYMFDRAKHIRADVPLDGARLVFGLDFNVEPMVAHVIAIWPCRLHYVDEVVIPNNAHTQMMAGLLCNKFPRIREVYPDPTGGARSVLSPRSNFQILRDMGLTVRAHPAPPEQVDRLNSWNRMLCDANGEVHLTISPKCKLLIADNERTERLPDGSIDKRKRDPHALDSASYCCEYENPVVRREVQSVARW